MGKLTHFNNPGLMVDTEEGEKKANKLIKKALLLVSGSHKDSKKRPHTFTEERIQRIADNTNRVLSEYGRVPLIKDHNKTSDSTIGDLEGEVYTKVITKDDLPDERLSYLIGKVGIFTDSFVVKSKAAIQGFMEGVHRTISPGIDVDTDEIREVSVTPLPAIKGLMAFHKGERGSSLSKFALTLDEAEQEYDDLDELKEQFEELGDLFWTVVESVSGADEDALQGADPRELLMQAVNDYMERLVELLQLEQEEEVPEQQQQLPQQGYPPMQQRRGAFSLANTEKNMAEFGLGTALKHARGAVVGGFGLRKSKSMVNALGRVAKKNPNATGVGFFNNHVRSNLAGAWGGAKTGYQQSGLIRNTVKGVGGTAAAAGAYGGYRALTGGRKRKTVTIRNY